MKLEKIIARHILFPSLIAAGYEKKIINRSKYNLLNLYYHGVVTKDYTNIFPRHILNSQFEDHLKYYVKNFDIISIEEAFELYRHKVPLKRKTITITFDDGYENNYLTALPLLEKYKVKASFYISGKCLEDDHYILWPDVLAFCRFLEKGNNVVINGIPFLKAGKYSLYNNDIKFDAGTYLKGLTNKIREKVIKDLKDRYKINADFAFSKESWKLLNKHQVKQLSLSPFVTIGSHGHSHINLDNLTTEEAEMEMRLSKQVLEDCIEKKITSIAFPDGAYNSKIKQMALSCDYNNLIAVSYQSPDDVADMNILPRYGLSCTTNKYSNFYSIAKAFNNRGISI